MTAPLTWTEFLKAVSGAMWTLIKSANWRSFEPLPETVEQRFRVVYWAAWHWGDLIKLCADLREAEQEFYILPADIKVDKDTGAVLEAPKYGTEFAPSPRVAGHRTRHAQVSGYWREFRMKGFPA